MATRKGVKSGNLYLGTMTTRKKAEGAASKAKKRGHTNVRITKTKFHGTKKNRYNIWGK